MAKYRLDKNVLIEAVQWDGTDETLDVIKRMGCPSARRHRGGAIVVSPGLRVGHVDDWILKLSYGDFHPCHPGLFELICHPVPE